MEKYFTLENTEGFTRAQLDQMNIEFPEFATELGFDLTDSDDLNNASKKYLDRL